MYKTATITYTYGNGLISDSRKEAKDSDTEKRYYHYNHIGSTTAITDADGDLLYRIAYGTYGELTGIYDTDGELVEDKTAVIRAENLRFLYNGRYGVETGANGLYYMRARYYNPQIKRFINRDIIDGSITDSQSLNKYSYVQGNPVSLIDPFGLCAQDYFSRAGHELLDWLGFIFDPADVINFLWYTAEGNAAMAAATAVAIVPAAGSFIAKGTKQAIKAGKKAAQKAGEKAAKNATEKAAKKAAAKKLAKEATETGVEKAAKEAAEKATEKTAKEVTEKSAERTAKEAVEKGAKGGYGKLSGNSGADNIADAAKLKEYYKQAEKYGTGSIKELQNGKFRFYEELKPARTQGEMAGARHVREWDPYTGYKQDWYETLDNNGNIRQVRPDPKITGGKKVHYMFDTDGNYTGNWVPNK